MVIEGFEEPDKTDDIESLMNPTTLMVLQAKLEILNGIVEAVEYLQGRKKRIEAMINTRE